MIRWNCPKGETVVAPVIVEAIGGLFGGLIGAIDDWHTSEEEKLLAKGKIFEAQGQLLAQVFEYERASLEAQAKIVTAEAQGESWIQRSWRPITMLTFVGLVVAHWFGFTPAKLSPETIDNLFTLVQIGLGGYVVGRSAEKVAKSINFNKAVETEGKS
jgi:hypothetical protein